MQPVARDERTIGAGSIGDRRDVDERDVARLRLLPQDRVEPHDGGAVRRGVAVVRARRRERVVGRRDGEHATRPDSRDDVIQDARDVLAVPLGRHAADDVVHPDEHADQLRLVLVDELELSHG
jgi:hypothetical protein